MCGGLLHNQEMLRITRKNPVTSETMHLVLAVEYIVYARLYSFWLLLFFLFFLGGFFILFLYKKVGFCPLAHSE